MGDFLRILAALDMRDVRHFLADNKEWVFRGMCVIILITMGRILWRWTHARQGQE